MQIVVDSHESGALRTAILHISQGQLVVLTTLIIGTSDWAEKVC